MSNSQTPLPSIIGGIFLVIGNVIGAGILALPIAIAQLGLLYAISLLVGFWLFMMLGAYYFLEANLALPEKSNLISMSRATLGKLGVSIAWACNLLVMYSLLAAYISGGADLIRSNMQSLGVSLPSILCVLLFVFIFGYIISKGVRITEYTNRWLILIKALLFFSVILGLSQHFQFSIVTLVAQKKLSVSLLMVVLTSFGFAILIPSLRNYYQSDFKKIKKIIFYGTVIPLICYIFWIIAVFCVIPYDGTEGLQQLAQSTHPVSALQIALNHALHSSWITQAMNLFSILCIITSFLANSISFTDFLADGFQLYGSRTKRSLVYVIAYLPPLCAVLFYPKAFMVGLSIAGSLAIIQLLLLPGCMVFALRYANEKLTSSYTVMGGKPLLLLLLVLATLLFFLSCH